VRASVVHVLSARRRRAAAGEVESSSTYADDATAANIFGR
jgi:hypothetical protein